MNIRPPGRPRLEDDPLVKQTAALPRRMRDAIRDYGNGNFSAGVRRLARRLMKKEESK